MKQSTRIILVILGFCLLNNPSVKAQSGTQYFRLSVDNDCLVPRQKTDRYYSSGIEIEHLVAQNPVSKYKLNKFFIKAKNAQNYFGWTLNSDMYTPANMTAQPMPGDRPFAGLAMAGVQMVSNSDSANIRFTSKYSAGVIGPAAHQEFMQNQWHKVIGRPETHGWENQIANDLAVNLSFMAEKMLYKPVENIELIGILETNVGTVSNFVNFGGMVRAGWFNDYFKNIMPLGDKRWQAFVFMRPTIRLVADNSLLEGGIFNYARSPYVISRDDISRYFLESEFGYSVSFRNVNFTYSQSFRTPEFKNAKNMYWGSIKLSVRL